MSKIAKKQIEEGERLLSLMKARFEEDQIGKCSQAAIHFLNLLDKIYASKAYRDIRRAREQQEDGVLTP